jgi:phosphoglycolate phosphatase
MQTVIIFDFDGVLADTLDDMLAFGAQASAHMGYPTHPTQSDLDALDRMSLVDYGQQLGLPEDRLHEFANRCIDLFAQKTQPPHIFPGMAQAIQQLSQSCHIGVVSGNGTNVIKSFLQHHGLENYVGQIYGADIPGTKAEKIGRLVTQAGETVEAAYMVGDAVSDIQAARQAGVKSIAVTWGHQSRARLTTAQPDYLVDQPSQLKALLNGHHG